MIRYIAILLILCCSGCATYKPKNIDLYEEYVRLSAAVKESLIEKKMSQFYTSSYLKEVNLNDEKSLFLLNLPNYMEKVESHYQKISGDNGCITVNGFEQNGDPLTLYLEYKNSNDLWLVNYIYLSLLDNKNKFVNKAVCPTEAEKQL